VDGAFIMLIEMNEKQKGYGYNRNHMNVIEIRTSLKWLPLVPIRAFANEDVAHKVIEDITGIDYKDVLFCDNPEYRITRYSSEQINELKDK
jgi:hypothetical protein